MNNAFEIMRAFDDDEILKRRRDLEGYSDIVLIMEVLRFTLDRYEPPIIPDDILSLNALKSELARRVWKSRGTRDPETGEETV